MYQHNCRIVGSTIEHSCIVLSKSQCDYALDLKASQTPWWLWAFCTDTFVRARRGEIHVGMGTRTLKWISWCTTTPFHKVCSFSRPLIPNQDMHIWCGLWLCSCVNSSINITTHPAIHTTEQVNINYVLLVLTLIGLFISTEFYNVPFLCRNTVVKVS